MSEASSDRWKEAARESGVDSALRSLYADIEAATLPRQPRPRCDQSGRCCHFEEFGHRMYITGLETAWFLNRLHAMSDCPSLIGRGSGGGSDQNLGEVDDYTPT